MAIRKATAEDLKKYVVSGNKSGMAAETRELIDGFRSLKLNKDEKLIVDVPHGTKQAKRRATCQAKLKTYLNKEEFAQVGFEYPDDVSVILIVRRTKAA